MSEFFPVEGLQNFDCMSRKHIVKYLQKYYLFLSSATLLMVVLACSTTKKVPEGEYLLTENHFTYTGEKIFSGEVDDYVTQKPNKKQLFLLPIGLWMYNAAHPKYDSILNEYATFPTEMRNQKLRDSLFIKYRHPEYVGKNLFFDRFMHSIGQPPVILDEGKTQSSANAIRKYLVYRGYWDAQASYTQKKDSARKKAAVTYHITPKDPTYIDGYFYDIPDTSIKQIYEQNIRKSFVKNKEILDQSHLEKEVKRLNDLMREQGFYKFNAENDNIWFTADTLSSRKQVPLTLEVHKDSADTRYKRTTMGNIKVYLLEKMADTVYTRRDSLFGGIEVYRMDRQYDKMALWRPIILKTKEVYDQKNLDLTKRNLASTNNFNIISYREGLRKGTDSILDVSYFLAPLAKYEFKVATDLNYSQILNFGISPSVDLTTRNVFGGAENITTSLSGTFGSVENTKNPDKRALAYEISAQAALNVPKLLFLPSSWYYKLIPKRYSPSSSVVLGTSVQDNIGLGRIGFNASLNFFANVNDIVSHRLTIFNTQFSLTRNKERYYDYFSGERQIVTKIHDDYFQENPEIENQYNAGTITYDQVSGIILQDNGFAQNYVNTSVDNQNVYYGFLQSLLNKERQTQDVLISSLVYNYIYNEIGKKDRPNPFYFNAKFELAGNALGLFAKKESSDLSGKYKTLFGIPYSQFVKFDFDIRKYFNFNGNQDLVLRQFVGIGIPYGNSESMPFVRSYFNGGSNDIRAWRVFGGLGPADLQTDRRVRAYMMDNVKLTTNIEYRVPMSSLFEGALFVDAGNIWSLKDSGFGDRFKFSKFIRQMGVGTGFGLRINVAYITLRLDAAYKVYDPNVPVGERWVIGKWQPLKPVINFAFGYPF